MHDVQTYDTKDDDKYLKCEEETIEPKSLGYDSSMPGWAGKLHK
jgi:hypothetical protein